MGNSPEEEDEYLYGSDSGNADNKKEAKVEAGDGEAEDTKMTEEGKESKEEANDEEEESENDDSDEEESDSDSDFELIVNAPESESKSGEASKADAKTDKDNATVTLTSASESIKLPGIDIDKVAQFEDKPLTQLDLEALKDKPWRLPGADISDYFNYGFNEITWTAYCHKQDKLRGEFDMAKFMASRMGPAMPMVQGMPPPMFGFGNMRGFEQPPPSQMQAQLGQTQMHDTKSGKSDVDSKKDGKKELPKQPRLMERVSLPRMPKSQSEDRDRDRDRGSSGYKRDHRDRHRPRGRR